MIPSRLLARWFCLLSIASAAWAQAIVEYAAKSSTSAASGTSRAARLGACPVDSALLSCLNHHYPAAFQISVVVVCLSVALFLLRPRQRA
jgi:hypothetical protein